jgi:lambda family phage tail tape measure protein
MAADNKTQIVISAKDETAGAFASAKAGLEKFGQAYAQLGAISGGAVVAGLVASVKSAIDLGDEMNDLSQRVGISVQNLATWTLAANQSGTSIESVAKGVKGLSKFMTENGAALKKAGVDASDANGALIQLADLFAAMPDGVEKTALAVKLFGKAGMDMIPMLNQGSAGLKEAAERSAEYGRKMALLAPLADKFNDQMAELALQSKEAGMSITTLLLPGLIGMATWLNDLKAGGERAETALEFLSDKSPLARGLIAWNKFINGGPSRSQGYAGPKNAQGLPAGQAEREQADLAAFDAATIEYVKGYEARKKAKELLGKDANDKESAYLAALSQQLLIASGDTSEYSKQLAAISSGPAKDFSQATKDAALALARKIDKLKEATKANEDHARVLEKVSHIEDAANKAVSDFGFKQDQNVAGIDSRTAALGKTPFEVKQAEAARAIEKDYEEAVKKVNEELGKIGDIEGISAKTYELSQARDKAHVATAKALDEEKAKQDALNASWEYGADTALRKYSEEIATVAATVEGAMTRAFKGMEDALVNFVKTGKLDFKSLADSIVTDLIRIEVQRSIMKPLTSSIDAAGGLSGLVKSFFGGGKAGGGAIDASKWYVVGENGPELFAPGQSGTVIPNGAVVGGSGGGSVVIHQTVNVDSRSDQASIMQAMVAAKNAAVQAVFNAQRRGATI